MLPRINRPGRVAPQGMTRRGCSFGETTDRDRSTPRESGSHSHRLGEGLGRHLVQELEVGDLALDELLAVALALGLRGPLDTTKVFIAAVGRLLGELFAAKAAHLRDELDGQ